MSNKLKCFVGHVFDRKHIDDFRSALSDSFGQFSKTIEFWYADEHLSGGQILTKIFHAIDEAHFCVFDVSDESKSNVFLELGFAYGREKAVVLLLEHGKKLPSDLAGYDYVQYESFKEMKNKISGLAPQILARASSELVRQGSHFILDRKLLAAMGGVKEGDEFKTEDILSQLFERTPLVHEIQQHLEMFRKIGWIEYREGRFVLTKRGAGRIEGGLEVLKGTTPEQCPQIMMPM